MQLIAPPGYAAVVPFDKEKHAGLGFSPVANARFAAALNAIYVTSMEFTQCAHHYPIVFSYNEAQHQYAPMIVTSFNSGHNAFVSETGDWDSSTYIPAYVRRYPFCVVEIPDSGPLVCVDETALEKKAKAFFNVKGVPSEAWARVESFMQEYEAARRASEAFVSSMAGHDLFEVFEAQAYSHAGKRFHMTNMYRISEKRLQMLPEKTLRQFMENKYMYFIYAHLLSLDNFQHLLDRSVTH